MTPRERLNAKYATCTHTRLPECYGCDECAAEAIAEAVAEEREACAQWIMQHVDVYYEDGTQWKGSHLADELRCQR